MIQPRFTISVLTFVALRQAKACIASVMKSTQPFSLILTANGNPEAAAYFTDLAKTFSNVEVIVNATNEGFIAPNEKAFKKCETDFFVMLNDDTIVPPDWLEKLAGPFDRYPTAALCAPNGGCQSLQGNFHGFKGPAFEYLEGSCLCCKAEVIRKIGLFDKNLRWAYGDDSDLSLRAREAGYSLHHADFILRHEVGATSKHVKEVRGYQDANHVYLRRRWAHYLRVRRMDFPILVRRTAAWGDVLLTTPIIQALKWKYPLSPIHLETACPAIFARNPNVASAGARGPHMPDALTFNLDMSYEGETNKRIVRAYAEKCGVTEEFIDDRTHLYPTDADHERAARVMPSAEWVALHVGPSTWRSKEWPHERFAELAAVLRSMGKKILLVGAHGKTLPSDLDQRGVTSIHEMAALIKRAQLFIGLDSLPMHVSQAMGTPTIGLFGVTDPKYILTSGSKHIGVCGTTESFGLRHRSPGTTHVDDGGAAMNSISVAMVLDAVNSLLATPVEA